MRYVTTSIRLATLTVVTCAVIYPAALWIAGEAFAPGNAAGSLVLNGTGSVVGSRLIAQGFGSPQYFHARPSAVGYDAAGAGGSNLAPSNPALRERASREVESLGATAAHPAPADLVAASGSGLDPHISVDAAYFQMDRVSRARGVSPEAIRAFVDRAAECPWGPLGTERIVNVLELNLALDRATGVQPVIR